MTAPRLMDSPAEAVAEWLLAAAARNPAQAREEWETERVAPLRCGGTFCALRVPVPLVDAIAPRTDPATVDAFLAEALHRAPAFRCNTGQFFYVLVQPTVAAWWESRRGVECIGEGHELGVPRLDLVGYPGRTVSYWAVPIVRPGHLGSGEAVSQMVSYARYRMARKGTL